MDLTAADLLDDVDALKALITIDNLIIERALRCVAIGRRNSYLPVRTLAANVRLQSTARSVLLV